MYTASHWSGASAPSHDGIRTLSLLITLAVSNSDHIPRQDQSGFGLTCSAINNLLANLVRTLETFVAVVRESGKSLFDFPAFPYVLNAALYDWPLVRIAHAIRAILFAIATMATLRGDRASSRSSHPPNWWRSRFTWASTALPP